MPHKFWQANYGAGLRKIIADGKHLKSVVDFGHQQVFYAPRGAKRPTTYTAIHVLGHSQHVKTIDYVRFDELGDGTVQCAQLDVTPPMSVAGTNRHAVATLPRGSGPFRFAAGSSEIAGSKPLRTVADLAQGFKTGADKVFVVHHISTAGGVATVESQASGRTHKVEAAALRPLVKSEHMKPYEVRPTNLRLVFPYECVAQKWMLIPADSMKSRYPLLWDDYLAELRPVLKKRESGRFDGELFYQYSRPQNFGPLSKPKIMNPDICVQPQMCWDSTGGYVFSGGAAGGVAIVPGPSIDHLLLLGILNSRFAASWIRVNGTQFRGEYMNCEIRFIRDFPVKLPCSVESIGRVVSSNGV